MEKKLLVVIALLLAGCAHQQVSEAPSGLDQIPAGASGLIFPVTLTPEGFTVPQEGCKLNIRRSVDLKVVPLTVTPGQHDLFLEVPAGVYGLADLSCGDNKTWDFTNKNWPPLQVLQGAVSLTTSMEFRITETGGMTTVFFNRNAVQHRVKDVFGKLSQATQGTLVSAYNRKAIHAEMVQESQYQITVRLPPSHVKEGEPDEANYPEFKKCYAAEFAVNPLYAGSMVLLAHYKGKAFTKIDTKNTPSLYSVNFVGCVKDTLQKFVPNRSDDLIYDVNL